MAYYTPEEDARSERPSAHRRRSRLPLQPFSLEHLRHLFAAAQGDATMHTLLPIAGTTGMRIGEVLALTWQQLDFGQQTLSVQRTMLFQPSQGVFEATPKREQDRRTIHLTPLVVAALKQLQVSHSELRSQAGDAWQAHGSVFCTAVGTPLDVSTVAIAYDAFLRSAGIPARSLHTLRYSAIDLFLRLGTHPDVVRAILGLRPRTSTVVVSPSPDAFPTLISEALFRLNTVLQGDSTR